MGEYVDRWADRQIAGRSVKAQWRTCLHDHLLVLTPRIQGPLIEDNLMIIGAPVPIQNDGVLGQSYGLIWARIGHWWPVHGIADSQDSCCGVGGSIRVCDSQPTKGEEAITRWRSQA